MVLTIYLYNNNYDVEYFMIFRAKKKLEFQLWLGTSSSHIVLALGKSFFALIDIIDRQLV